MTNCNLARRLLIGARVVLIAAAALAAPLSFADAKWPMEKPMMIVVPWPAGSSFDVVARVIAAGIQKKYGNVVVVENRTGASGNIGQASVAKAAPDGYTFIVTTPGPAANNVLTFKSLPYNPLTDFSFISVTNKDPSVLVVRRGLNVNTFEFVAYAKANPGKVKMGSPGNGTYSHDAARAPGPRGNRIHTSFRIAVRRKCCRTCSASTWTRACPRRQFHAADPFRPAQGAGHFRGQPRSGTAEHPHPDRGGLQLFLPAVDRHRRAEGAAARDHRRDEQDGERNFGDKANVEKLATLGMTAAPSTPEEFEKLVKGEVEKWRPIVTKYKVTSE
ncbi:MAG: tripartite tricarboxylate transporter substrate binding protein [Betaproteobacteria bacterium]|nr:tripartite tricarboxylate transporter substrate binding protein [Betaproteobacteria bacterium]